MIEPLQLDGITYDREMLAVLRECVLELRDAALRSNAFAHSITLSQVHAVLLHLEENTAKEGDITYAEAMKFVRYLNQEELSTDELRREVMDAELDDAHEELPSDFPGRLKKFEEPPRNE